MTYGEQSLDDYECRLTQKRILHDGELIKSGARIVPPGILLLTDVQLELAQRRSDPLYVPWLGLEFVTEDEGEQSPRTSWLETDVFTLADPDVDGALIQKSRLFEREHMPTIRDLLVMGKDMVSQVRGVGNTTIERLDAIISSNEFDVTWEDQPDIHDIIAVCESLDQVNANVLFHDMVSDFSFCHFRRWTSVRDVVLAGPNPKDEQKLIDTYHPVTGKDLELYQAAKLFAVQFEDAQYAEFL